MKNPLRYWRTGAIAVVMAALGQAGATTRGGADERQHVRRQSPYGIADTVLRIEGSAREHGMTVFARFEPGAGPAAPGGMGSATQVIVLASSQGGTPVLMGEMPARMELPLSLIVRLASDGRAEVLIGVAQDWDAMPQALALDLARMTEVVGDALRV